MEHLIKLNSGQLQIISAALCEIPYRMAAPIIDSINKQINKGQTSQPLDENGVEIPQ
jgi:hypothetical protein